MEVPDVKPELPPGSDPLGEVSQLLQFTGFLYCDAQLTDPGGIELPQLPGVTNVEVVTSGHCWIAERVPPDPLYKPGCAT